MRPTDLQLRCQCIGCGLPRALASPPAAAVTNATIDRLRREQATASGVICPTCGGEDTSKLSLIHADGLTHVHGSISSTDITGGLAGGPKRKAVSGVQQSPERKGGAAVREADSRREGSG